jgi:hypothetical protein
MLHSIHLGRCTVKGCKLWYMESDHLKVTLPLLHYPPPPNIFCNQTPEIYKHQWMKQSLPTLNFPQSFFVDFLTALSSLIQQLPEPCFSGCPTGLLPLNCNSNVLLSILIPYSFTLLAWPNHCSNFSFNSTSLSIPIFSLKN